LKRYRAILHLAEKDRASLALNNVNNLLADLGDDLVEAEILANSEGVAALLKASPLGERVEELAARGVRFAVCSRTLRAMGIGEEEVIAVAEVVPTGTGELVKRQSEGWAYVRP
jgi:hypothetical protein